MQITDELSSENPENPECPICYESLVPPVILVPCGHVMCGTCVLALNGGLLDNITLACVYKCTVHTIVVSPEAREMIIINTPDQRRQDEEFMTLYRDYVRIQSANHCPPQYIHDNINIPSRQSDISCLEASYFSAAIILAGMVIGYTGFWRELMVLYVGVIYDFVYLTTIIALDICGIIINGLGDIICNTTHVT